MTTDLATYAVAIHETCNSHDIERILHFCSPDFTGSDLGRAALLHGYEDLRTLLGNYLRAFPDLRVNVTGTVVEGSRVAVVWVAEGTHRGPIMNIPPTGHRVEVRGMSIIDVEEGLIVRGQYIWDLAGMLRHMGLLPQL